MNAHVTINQVKRDISELVYRVSFAGERIILTSRGKPKAALISMEDDERLLNSESRATNIWQGIPTSRLQRDMIADLKKRNSARQGCFKYLICSGS